MQLGTLSPRSHYVKTLIQLNVITIKNTEQLCGAPDTPIRKYRADRLDLRSINTNGQLPSADSYL